MRNFKLSRMGHPARWARSSALAWGPFIAAVACNVYDDSLIGGVSAPLGGSGADAGSAGTATVAGGGSGGMPSAGSDAGGSAGVSTSGKAGDVAGGGGGVAGTSTGGGAGTPAMGGSAGSGGEPPLGDGDLVDNMEDDDAAIDASAGRNGYWYVGNDETKGAVMTPPSGTFAMAALPMGDRSKFAAGLKAENFTGWGSDIGFNFHELAGVKPYDASAYCGLRYWGKAATAVSVRFRVPDVDTHPDGKICTNPGGAGTACFDHFGISHAFTTAWKQFSTKFSELTQIGTGYHPADNKLKVDKLFAVEWALPGGAAKTYEIWIDDVELMKCP
jgi:hypothetical protein